MDCPQTNRLLEKVRYRLEETAYQINTAKREAPRTRERIEKTWLLQDRIDFQEKVIPLFHTIDIFILSISESCLTSLAMLL